MIQHPRQGNALYALNTVLVLARQMSYEEKEHSIIADVLDVAEYLVKLIAQPEDCTNEFGEQLNTLARKYKEFRLAAERFEKDNLPVLW